MIYCLEDAGNIRELILYTLRSTGFEASGFSDSKALWEALEDEVPDLLILDIMLPGEDGISVLKRLKTSSRTKNLPVIMATARSSEYDKVLGLDSGADDYIAKPFGMMELLSRVKAVLRRTAPASQNDPLIAGSITLNPDKHLVLADGEAVTLTLKEFDLLRSLMEHPGVVFTRDRLLEDIWGYDFDGETRTVDVHVRTLRQKLGKYGALIETVRGVGYRMGGTP
jgi:two-component system alkaline phosphatase synthesis response regulator PhoP